MAGGINTMVWPLVSESRGRVRVRRLKYQQPERLKRHVGCTSQNMLRQSFCRNMKGIVVDGIERDQS